MASTVTWDGLRDLAGFRAQNGCAISLYLDLDPSATPTAADLTTRVNALIDEIERSEAARRPELGHEEKEGLRSDVHRLREFFEQDFERDAVSDVRELGAPTRRRSPPRAGSCRQRPVNRSG